MTLELSKDSELMKLVKIMWTDEHVIELTQEQQMKIDTFWRALFINQENLFLHYKEGSIPESYWIGKSATTKMHLRSQRSRDWWKENYWHFDPELEQRQN